MKKPVNIRLDDEVLQKSKKIAEETKRSLTQLITDLLLKNIKQNEKGK